MNWTKAKQMIEEGFKVKRSNWSVWLHRCEEGGVCVYRNVIASQIVGYSPFEPSKEDVQAEDWEVKD
jgi:hypothetical protein